jgi:NTP pyrophosphatase (non-canonical NTP hydrolase)
VLALVRKHRFQGKSLDRSSLAAELGDALWCLAIIAHSAGFRLSEIGARNADKLRQRHPRGFASPAE